MTILTETNIFQAAKIIEMIIITGLTIRGQEVVATTDRGKIDVAEEAIIITIVITLPILTTGASQKSKLLSRRAA